MIVRVGQYRNGALDLRLQAFNVVQSAEEGRRAGPDLLQKRDLHQIQMSRQNLIAYYWLQFNNENFNSNVS